MEGRFTPTSHSVKPPSAKKKARPEINRERALEPSGVGANSVPVPTANCQLVNLSCLQFTPELPRTVSVHNALRHSLAFLRVIKHTSSSPLRLRRLAIKITASSCILKFRPVRTVPSCHKDSFFISSKNQDKLVWLHITTPLPCPLCIQGSQWPSLARIQHPVYVAADTLGHP